MTAEVEAEAQARFSEIQRRLKPLFESVLHDTLAPRTVVVVPGLSLDADVLAEVPGARHYEERQLSMLMLLRMPHTRIVFVTSTPIPGSVVDYYLNLLSGIPWTHARKRLTLLSAHDASPRSVTEKILERPRLLHRIRAAMGDSSQAHLSVFNATKLERDLAIALDIPLYACDPALSYWGSKSGSREAFRRAGLKFPDGRENLRSMDEVAAALVELRQRNPALRKAVVKLDEGFSGDGNALFDFQGAPEDDGLEAWVQTELPKRLRFEAAGMNYPRYASKFQQLHGIVEAWIDGDHKRSPSVQMRVNALGCLETISTHDQLLGGPNGQVFLGSHFPANVRYRGSLQECGQLVGKVLQAEGVLGRFSVDFISVLEGEQWQHYAIEINLRKGGTTLPYQMLQFLTAGRVDANGEFQTPLGQVRCYRATDNLVDPRLKRLVPEDLIDILVERRLHFDEITQQGVVFNLIGALSEFGKLGLVAIAPTREAADAMFEQTVTVLLMEAEKA
ncbi:MAG: peptide ligase PGM1-related protein [Lysobacterales bacterium]|nr:hypothetical protein [Xanthomonadales bacterium]MCP5476628.1 carboxylate-amine ligase [Rhodanobacteraceae bacterium]